MNRIWIVEMREGRKYVPTTGASLSRAEGRIEVSQWRNDNPNDLFRVRAYVEAESAPKKANKR